MKFGYSTLFIKRKLGIDNERLRVWVANGWIKPTIPAKGQGTRAAFSENDLFVIVIFNRLLELGMNRKAAASIISDYSGIKGEVLSRADYFMFKIIHKDDEIMIESTFYVGMPDTKASIITLYPNRIYIAEVDEDAPASPGETWNDLHVINLNSIRHRVEEAIKDEK